jgi:cyclopropane-fatty-acyl-phospholipid synthase
VARTVGTLGRRLDGDGVPPFELRFYDGSAHRLGGGPAADRTEAPAFVILVRTPAAARALASLDELRVGESYLRGDLDVRALARFVIPLIIGQDRSDRANVPHHYCFGNDFYLGFLDQELGLYSQALYTSDDQSLEQAVRNKLDYIIRACRLGPGSHVLDVGAGWGALARYFSARGITVTMLTLSQEQYTHLEQLAASPAAGDRLRLQLANIFTYDAYRQYDAITLLGVMEHLPDYPKLFAQFERLLRPAGLVYMDFAAGRRKFDVGAFVYRHIFPGNHSPVYMPGLLKAANGTSFEPIALHNDRHSYFLTLRAWARNLEANRERLVDAAGEQVYRLFRLYLWGGANMFQRDGSLESYRVLFQKARGMPSSVIGL